MDDQILRVLAIIPGNGSGNSMIFARRQIASLQKLGVTVCTFWIGSRTSPLQLLRDWRRLRREIRRFRPHLVHAHYGTATAFLAAVATRLPRVVTYRGSDLNRDPEVTWLRSRSGMLLSQVASLGAHVICVTDELRHRLWWGAGKTLVLADGVNTELFQPCAREEARRRLGLDPHARLVLFNQGDTPLAKGRPLVEAAVEIAQRQMGPVQLLVLDGRVPAERMPDYVNAADCVVLASRNEGSPNMVKEALACNVPVVSVDVGDVAERLRGVHPSAIVDRNPLEFGNAVAKILQTSGRSNGREAAMSVSEERTAATILALYQHAVSKQQSGLAGMQDSGAAIRSA
jgi:teichuronic acid biosynthesis glycosyltransferase TuaC